MSAVAVQVWLLLFSLAAPLGVLAAEIQTDLWVYNDGDTVTVSGIEFGPGEVVELVSTDPEGTEVDRGTVTTDETGSFTYQFVFHPTISGLYDVVGTGVTSGLTASTRFDPFNIEFADPGAMVWHRTVSGGFDVTASGTWACQGNCDSATNLVFDIFPSNNAPDTVAGTAILSRTVSLGGASGNNVPWTTTFQFRSSPGAGQFPIPADGRYDLRGTFNGIDSPSTARTETKVEDDYFAVDNTRPTSSVAAANPNGAAALTASGTAADPGAAPPSPTGSGLLGGTVRVEIRNGAPGGSLVAGTAQDVIVNAAGNWSYSDADDPEAPGTYCVVSVATDRATSGGNVQDPIGSLCYTIAAPNEPPVAVDDTATTAEDTAKVFPASGAGSLVFNDTDPNGNTLTVTAVANPVNGTVSVLAGVVTFTPAANVCAPNEGAFDYTVSDGSLTDIGHVTITITCVNDHPDAVDDEATVAEDSGANAIDVLANDDDLDGDTLTITATTDGADGSVAITGGGSGLTYTPDADFCGDDSFTYTISDGNGGTDTATVDVEVTCANDAPVVLITGGPTLVDESTTTEHTYTFAISDADIGDTFSVAAGYPDCGGEGAFVAGSLDMTAGTFRCRFADGDALSTVAIRVQDAAAALSNIATRSVTIRNVAPTVLVTGPDNVDEGDTATFTVDTSDPGAPETFTAGTPSCGSGAYVAGSLAIAPATGDGSFQCFFADDNPTGTAFDFTAVGVTVSDGDGGSGPDTFALAVNNVAPSVAITGPEDVDEGATWVYDFTVIDVAPDTFTLQGVSCGDIADVVGTTTFDSATGAGSFSCSFPDDDPSGTVLDPTTLSVAVRDDDLGDGIDTLLVEVHNVDPSVTITGAAAANEGATGVLFGFTVTDPGLFDTIVGFSIPDCGASGAYVDGTLAFDNGTRAGVFRCAFPDDNPTGTAADTSVLALTVVDDDAGEGADTHDVLVSNLPPSVVVSGPADVDENQALVEYAFDTNDPGTDTFSRGDPSCGASGTWVGTVVFDAATGDGTFTCRFSDDAPGSGPTDPSVVSIAITDDDTGSHTGSRNVTVHNVDPVIEITGATAANEGQTKVYDVTVTDDGALDTFTFGTPDCGLSGDYVTASFGFSHVTRTGTFACAFPDDDPTGTSADNSLVTLTVTDDDTGTDDDSLTVNVSNLAPSVAVSGPLFVDEGDTGTFPVDTTDAGVADTFDGDNLDCGTGTPVAASLVIDPDTGDGSFQCLFADDNPTGTAQDGTTVGVDVTDDDTGSDTGTHGLTVRNVAPVVTIDSGASSVLEGDPATTYAYSFTDPGADVWTHTVSCGATGTLSDDVFTPATKSGSFKCAWADDVPTGSPSDLETVSVTVSDDDTGTDTKTRPVTVNDVAAVVGAVSVTFNPVTHVATATATYTDAGVLDSHSATASWNVPGTSETVSHNAATRTVTARITLSTGCTPVVTATINVTDDDTLTGSNAGTLDGPADAYDVQFRPPIKDDVRNIAKAGSTIPVKLVLTRTCGAGGTATDVDLYVTIAAGVSAGEIQDDLPNLVQDAGSSNDSGQKMRIADGGYIYNFSTKGLSNTSDYTLRIRLGGTSAANPIVKTAVIRTQK